MEFKVISSSSAEGLSRKIKESMDEGYQPVGSHQVVELHRQNNFSGSQHMSTVIRSEYSMSMIKSD